MGKSFVREKMENREEVKTGGVLLRAEIEK